MIFTILISKLIAKALNLLNFGATTLPGRVALRLKIDILNRLSKGVKIICVTGTNGKTTTCALLEYAMNKKGLSYFINKSGANMLSGVATAFIMNCNLLGKCKREYAILECDENSFPEISRYLDASIVGVTNIFRDQLDRYGELDSALNSIISAVGNLPKADVVLNADCPLTYSISKHCENRIITFGINENLNFGAVSDNRYCPICKSELRYSKKTYAQLGDYLCPKCNYRRVDPDVCAESISDISDEGASFILAYDDKTELAKTSLGGIYNIYNYCCACAILKTMGIYESGLLFGFSGAFGRMEKFVCENKTVLLLLVKNPVGYSNCLSFASNIKSSYSAVFALNDNDADGCDVSWIWDTSFSKLKGCFENAYTIGKRSLDMALRLKYDGITVSHAFDGERYGELIKLIKQSEGDFVVFANYTSMMNMRKCFVEAFGGKNFWE